MRRPMSFVPVAGFLVFWSLVAVPARAQEVPEGPGKEAFVRVCSACHSVESSTSTRRSKAVWQEVVIRMVDFGADATKDEREAIVNYLADHFGPAGTAKVNVNTAAAREIESGLKLTSKEAEAIVQYRQQHGHFKDWRELLKIDGVDARKIEAAQERIVL